MAKKPESIPDAANQLLRESYQSCRASEAIVDRKKIADQNNVYPYDFVPDPKLSCQDIADKITTPNCKPSCENSSYGLGFGKRPNLERVFELSAGLVPGDNSGKIDCSAFLAQIFARSGRKLVTDQKEFWDLSASNTSIPVTSTGQLLALSDPNHPNHNKSCVEDIKISKTETVQAGDVMVWDGHVFVISKSGADPFGLEKISDCSTVKLENYKSLVANFDFEITHSSPYYVSKDVRRAIGPSKTTGSFYLGSQVSSKSFKQGVMDILKRACVQRLSGTEIPSFGASGMDEAGNRTVAITRTLDKEECFYSVAPEPPCPIGCIGDKEFSTKN